MKPVIRFEDYKFDVLADQVYSAGMVKMDNKM